MLAESGRPIACKSMFMMMTAPMAKNVRLCARSAAAANAKASGAAPKSVQSGRAKKNAPAPVRIIAMTMQRMQKR